MLLVYQVMSYSWYVVMTDHLAWHRVVYYQCAMLLASPAQWLSGCVFWLIESFVYLILLQPSDHLLVLQRLGLLWGVMLFSHWLAMVQLLTHARVNRLVELSAISGMKDVWCFDLIALWLIYSLLMIVAMPIIAMFYGLNFAMAFWVVLLWLIGSPVVFLQLYLARLMTLMMHHGLVWGLCFIVPWLVPGVLLVMWCFSSVIDGVDSFSRCVLLLGVSMLQMLLLRYVIRSVLRSCYCHRLLHSVRNLLS